MNNIKKLYNKVKDYLLQEVNLQLLLFLILICNHRYTVKVVAIILFFLFNIKYKIKFKLDKIHLFYLSMIAIGILNLFLSGFSKDYSIIVACGCFIWVLNLIAYRQLTFYVERSKSTMLLNTIKLFTLLNFLFSFIDFFQVMIITETINPYTQLSPPPYGTMSGDLIHGLFGTEHLSNSCVSGLLFVYLLYKKEFKIGIFALITLLLASSNLTILAVIMFIAFAIIFIKDKRIKYHSIISLAIILTFYTKVNPYNYHEILQTFKLTKDHVYQEKIIEFALNNQDKEEIRKREIDSLQRVWNEAKIQISDKQNIPNNHVDTLSQNSISLSIPDVINKPDESNHEINLKKELLIREKQEAKDHLHEIWSQRDSEKILAENSKYYNYGNLKKFNIDSCPGLIISLNQTKDLLLSGAQKFLFGNGIGNFSSRLAFMSTKEGESSRLFQYVLPQYEHKDFKENHKAIWKYVDYAGKDYHSIKHLPFSGYNQILGEYGIIGFCCFLFFYVGYFAFKWKKLGVIKFLIPFILIIFGMYYWFESFVVMIIYELLMLTEVKSNEELSHSKQ